MTIKQRPRRPLIHTLALFVFAVVLTTPPSPPTVIGKPVSATTHALPAYGEVLRDYAPSEKRWRPGYRGVDLNAPLGQPIRASASGVVHFAGSVVGMTSAFTIHVNGTHTICQSIDTALEKGDHVAAGQVIGHLVVSARRPEPGLHQDVLHGKDYLNPLDLIQRRPIMLKPVRN